MFIRAINRVFRDKLSFSMSINRVFRKTISVYRVKNYVYQSDKQSFSKNSVYRVKNRAINRVYQINSVYRSINRVFRKTLFITLSINSVYHFDKLRSL